jgi:ribosomal protein L30/L7E
MLNTAVHCILVRFDDEARELLRKVKEWLEYAIGIREVPGNYFHGGTEATRHKELALCNWLLSDCHDRENLAASVHWRDIYFAEDTRPIKADVAPTLPLYLDAGKYMEALGLFGRLWGPKRPTNVKRIRGEAGMSYVIAATKVRHEYSEDDVKASLNNFLSHQVPEFLDHGNYQAMARWLKIAFWNENPQRLSAFETVRKCYDYLPNVVRP